MEMLASIVKMSVTKKCFYQYHEQYGKINKESGYFAVYGILPLDAVLSHPSFVFE